MNMFIEAPNIVKITVSDGSSTGDRFVVGKDLDTVLAMIGTAFGVESTVAKDKPKIKRTRRTKAQLTAAKDDGIERKDTETVWPG